MVFSRKSANSRDGVKLYDRNELNLISKIPPKELDSLVTGNLTSMYAREYLILEKRFVGIGITRHRPAMPNSTDHVRILLRYNIACLPERTEKGRMFSATISSSSISWK
jgi:hypothetical protein